MGLFQTSKNKREVENLYNLAIEANTSIMSNKVIFPNETPRGYLLIMFALWGYIIIWFTKEIGNRDGSIRFQEVLRLWAGTLPANMINEQGAMISGKIDEYYNIYLNDVMSFDGWDENEKPEFSVTKSLVETNSRLLGLETEHQKNMLGLSIMAFIQCLKKTDIYGYTG